MVTEKLEAKTAELNGMKSQFEVNLKDKTTEFDQTKAELTQVNQQLQMKIEEVVEITGIVNLINVTDCGEKNEFIFETS